jgi:hypothetical protein
VIGKAIMLNPYVGFSLSQEWVNKSGGRTKKVIEFPLRCFELVTDGLGKMLDKGDGQLTLADYFLDTNYKQVELEH